MIDGGYFVEVEVGYVSVGVDQYIMVDEQRCGARAVVNVVVSS